MSKSESDCSVNEQWLSDSESDYMILHPRELDTVYMKYM